MDSGQIIIPKEIDYSESCLRCIASPLQYDKKRGRFRINAILPPPNRDRNDVSLSRESYVTSFETIVDRGKSIKMGDSEFYGIASFTRADVKIVNEEHKDSVVNADIVYAPMHGDSYVSPEIDVYVNDPNVDKPDHAELRYSVPYNKTDILNTPFREYANSLIKRLTMVYTT